MSLNNLNTLTNLRTRTESKRDAGTNETTIIIKSKMEKVLILKPS